MAENMKEEKVIIKEETSIEEETFSAKEDDVKVEITELQGSVSNIKFHKLKTKCSITCILLIQKE